MTFFSSRVIGRVREDMSAVAATDMGVTSVLCGPRGVPGAVRPFRRLVPRGRRSLTL
jgi:hypothetical protein